MRHKYVFYLESERANCHRMYENAEAARSNYQNINQCPLCTGKYANNGLFFINCLGYTVCVSAENKESAECQMHNCEAMYENTTAVQPTYQNFKQHPLYAGMSVNCRF